MYLILSVIKINECITLHEAFDTSILHSREGVGEHFCSLAYNVHIPAEKSTSVLVSVIMC